MKEETDGVPVAISNEPNGYRIVDLSRGDVLARDCQTEDLALRVARVALEARTRVGGISCQIRLAGAQRNSSGTKF